MLAVFVREFENLAQFYQMNGKWANRTLRTVRYNVPDFFHASDLSELINYLPSEEASIEMMSKSPEHDVAVPREIGAKLVKGMTGFFNEAEDVYRKHASTLDNAHQILAHPTDHTFGTLEKIASKLIGTSSKGKPLPLSQAALYAVHRALVHSGYGFSVDVKNHRKSNLFQIRPKEQVQRFERVRGWLRDYQEALAVTAGKGADAEIRNHSTGAAVVQEFVEKAQQLIRQSRSMRPATLQGCVGPSKYTLSSQNDVEPSLIPSLEFSTTDRDIVRFMEAHALTGTFKLYSEYKGLAPIILRAVGAYQGYPLTYATVFMFLQEIGVTRPFENRTIFDPDLMLPGTNASRVVERLTHSAKILANESSEQGTLTDTLQDLRRDWGKMDVFCIDDEGAKEIDDGLSLEAIPDSPSEYWVHIHVANPSAFFDHTSIFAKFAGHQTETLYLPEMTFPMLPKRLTQTHFSLASGRPVLTFSARLAETGELVDFKITPGIIRNVTFVTNDDVLRAVGGQPQPPENVVDLVVGGQPPTTSNGRRPISLKNWQKEQLAKLHSLAHARRLKFGRHTYGAAVINTEYDVTLWSQAGAKTTGLIFNHPHRERARFHEVDPIIRMRATRVVDFDTGGVIPGADNVVVAESMILACEVAALWCKARNIPGIYRCTFRNPDKADPTAWAAENLSPWLDKGLPLPMHLVDKIIGLYGRTFALSEPQPHTVLGTEAYTKVTSPLRRYGDLFMHWQIGAALREEARVGRSLIGSVDVSYLPFKKTEIDQLLIRLDPRERMLRRASQHATRFWSAMCIFRAHYFKEAELPQILTAYVIQTDMVRVGKPSLVWCWELSMEVDMLVSTDIVAPEPGDVWEARIAEVNVYQRSVCLEPIRLLRKIVRPF